MGNVKDPPQYLGYRDRVGMGPAELTNFDSNEVIFPQ